MGVSVLSLRINYRETTALLRSLMKWALLGGSVGVASGVASAVLLHSLNWATATREQYPFFLFLLPLAGLAIGWIYDRYGRTVAAGNNLLLNRIHAEETTAIPFRMVPLVFVGTVITHLFGGSAGREGTAVQMGGTLANLATRWLKLTQRDHRLLIMSGISGGFGSVFGTPLAGAVFGLEVLTVGKIDYEGLFPCLVASIVGDVVCRALGANHPVYSVGISLPAFTPLLYLLIAAASVLFAGASALFGEATHAISHQMARWVKTPALRPVLGGVAVIALTYLIGTRDYLGLSLPLIARCFDPASVGSVALGAFALKILFTAITLGTGFKGGEVTPLFCIGATLGVAFARLTGQDPTFFAALGFVAVFSGATNTPLACTLMGIELFGSGLAAPLFTACVITYVLSGHRGIYLSQRIGTPKAHGIDIREGTLLSDARNGGVADRVAPPPEEQEESGSSNASGVTED